MAKDKGEREVKLIKKSQKQMVQKLKKYASSSYIQSGRRPILLLTPFYNRREENPFLGMVKYIAKKMDCHAMYIDEKVFDDSEKIAESVNSYIKRNKIHAVLLLADVKESKSIVEFEIANATEPDYLCKIACYQFEYQWKKFENSPITVSVQEWKTGGLLSAITENSSVKCVKLCANEGFTSAEHLIDILLSTLKNTVMTISNLDEDASRVEVYRLGQSYKHKPQDKVELYEDDSRVLGNYSYVGLCNESEAQEWVRLYYLHKPDGKQLEEKEMDKLFLTNRLIERMYGREWIEKNEETPGLEGAPVVLFECTKDEYPLGVAKANRIDHVYFSSELYKELREDANRYDFAVFNKYTDSMLYVDFTKADYDDGGRVKDKNDKPAQKVMMPRYYKILLGYIEEPLKRIREEEYKIICCESDETAKSEEQKCFERCYEKIVGQPYYALKQNMGTEKETEEALQELYEIQKKKGFFSYCEVLKIPKYRKKENKIKALWNKFIQFLLNIFIDKSEYLLKTVWTSETDDKNNVARLNSNMMRLMGVAENDKITVKFGNHETSMRVLTNDELTDYEIGIPAPARKKLEMNTVHDIVSVHRDMVHIFFRHSEAQTMTIFGTVLTVCQLTDIVWLRIVLSIFFAILSMYLVLNEERIKVK